MDSARIRVRLSMQRKLLNTAHRGSLSLSAAETFVLLVGLLGTNFNDYLSEGPDGTNVTGRWADEIKVAVKCRTDFDQSSPHHSIIKYHQHLRWSYHPTNSHIKSCEVCHRTISITA